MNLPEMSSLDPVEVRQEVSGIGEIQHEHQHQESSSEHPSFPRLQEASSSSSEEGELVIRKKERAQDDIDTTRSDTAASPSPSPVPLWSRKWTRFVLWLRKPLRKLILVVATHAARHPISYVISIVLLSLSMLTIGFATNFNVDVDEDVLWTPKTSRALRHSDWINHDSGFTRNPRFFNLLVHADGANVLGEEGIRRMFAAYDTIRNTDGYEELCATYAPGGTCGLAGVTAFWNHNTTLFEEQMADDSNLFGVVLTGDQRVIFVLSTPTYPDGTKIDTKSAIGYPERDQATDLLSSGLAYLALIELPAEEGPTKPFEKHAIDRMLALQEEWDADDSNIFRVEFFAERSFADEFERSIVNDLPLVPIIFMIMGTFVGIVFWKRDWINSRSMLGFGAVCTVALSIMTAYGLLFTIGVPFTAMTQMAPFIIFGVGIDDTFLISGAYARTDYQKDAVERIRLAIDEVGASIALTTITSTLAFGLGCTSSIPAVYWLCLYLFPAILIDFVYQITFFPALVVLDERRIKAKRRDVFCCSKVQNRVDEDEEQEEVAERHISDSVMAWYAERLLRPWVKAIVLVGFAALCCVLTWRASLLERAFDFTSVVPDDSYITRFVDGIQDFTQRTGAAPRVYFRDIDQSSPDVQDEMLAYVDQLVELNEISDPPVAWWLPDFRAFVDSNSGVKNLSFEEQMDRFLADPSLGAEYAEHIVRNAEGNVTASRTKLFMDQVDIDAVIDQVNGLQNQRRVSSEQPANVGRKDWALFTFDDLYFVWEFYRVAAEELLFTTIVGVAAVSVVSFFFIPHWTAVLFVFPMISVLYVDLMGVLQIAGISINAVSYISLVMSIGLLVDFVIHVIVRYYESTKDGRDAKAKDMLSTIGASVLLGGFSTFLGIMPLAFASSDIFYTVFVSFIGLVTLGLGHGLILLPVILSLLGPTVSTSLAEESEARDEIEGSTVQKAVIASA